MLNKKILSSALFLLAFLLAGCGQQVPANAPLSNADNANTSLIGTWKTDCLIPKPSDQWAELHTFVFENDNTATHNRKAFFKAGCGGAPDMDDTNRYSYGFETGGKIDFMELDQGVPLYDIYAVEENTLRFGHGFRNDAVFAGSGSIPEDRIKILNNFILYKRQ